MLKVTAIEETQVHPQSQGLTAYIANACHGVSCLSQLPILYMTMMINYHCFHL